MPDWKPEIRRRLDKLKLEAEREEAIVEELAQYLDDCYAELLAMGASEPEAERRAIDELSDGEILRRELRRVEREVRAEPVVMGAKQRRSSLIADLWQDLRFGARMLARHPGFTLLAVITLALGIGANTAIFSVVNAVLIRPLPYEASERLVYVWDSNPAAGFPRFDSSPPNFADWQKQQQSFEHLAAFMGWSFNFTGRGEPERLQGARVSAELFPLLGVKPLIGRTFLPEEDKAGNNRVVLLGHGLWQRRFAAERSVLGQAITLNNESYTIVGVISASFNMPDQTELWIPGGFDDLTRRGNHFLGVIGRLKPGVTIDEAQRDMEGIARRLEEQYPETNRGWSVLLVPLHEAVVGDVRSTLWVLLGAVGCVLLVACVNVANLLLARASSRRREMAIRLALGAGRWRVARQLLTESSLLSFFGGALGLLLGIWSVGLLISLGGERIPRADEIGLDYRVLSFTLLVSLLTGLIFGLAPALQGSSADLNEALKEDGKGGATPWRGKRSRKALVAAELALSLVLLAGAGLLLKSFLRLQQVDPGFRPEKVLTMQISLPPGKYAGDEPKNIFYRRLLQGVSALPGVEAAGVVDPLPLSGDTKWEFFIEGGPRLANGGGQNANFRRCSPDYFRTLGIRLLRGRLFDERDNAASEQVVIINRTLERRLFPDIDALGKRIAFDGPDGPWHTIVGVVGDVRHLGLNREAGLELYRPFAQEPARFVTLAVKSALEPASLAAAIRREVSKIDADQPIHAVRSMDEMIERDIAPQRFNLLLLAIFAAIAVLLSAIGIYGVMSYAVAERRREIGVRIALGAGTGDVLSLFLKEALRLTLAGVACGLGGALALTRLMSSMLFEVSATDPVTFIVVAIGLIGVAMAACYIPARRAMRVDPMTALRCE